MPMKTTLVGASSGVRSRISRIWPAISKGVRFRRKPIRPVAQKEQRSAQPAWEEMQRVRRLPDGMSTDSTASPSLSRQRYFRVPSTDCWTTSAWSRGRGSVWSSSARSASGSSVASAQRETGACQSRRSSCATRYRGNPRAPVHWPRAASGPGRREIEKGGFRRRGAGFRRGRRHKGEDNPRPSGP